MNKKFLIGLGITVLVLGVGTGVYFAVKDKDDENGSDDGSGGGSGSGGDSGSGGGSGKGKPKPSDDKSLVGKAVYARGTDVNVRDSALVDDGKDLPLVGRVFDNRIGKVKANSRIGTIRDVVWGEEKTPYRWYKVSLAEKLDGKERGYVREDAVEVR